MGHDWIVARCKPGRTSWAVENVAAQGAQYYLPRVLVQHRAVATARPLFGPYLFVHFIERQWRFLLNTFGIAGVILFGEYPAVVREQVIANIRAMEVDGLVVLPKPPDAPPRWKLGSALRVKGGVFTGNYGIYQGSTPKQRERVLLDFLGRKTSVLLLPDQLEAA